jgi:hypothetical protein
MILANVIFPTFLYPMVSMMIPMIGIWILVSETFGGLIINRNKNKIKSVWGILLANLCSSILGASIGALLSLIPGEPNDVQSPTAPFYIIISYSIAFFISVFAEGLVLLLISKKKKDLNVWSTVWVCNSVSYFGILDVR